MDQEKQKRLLTYLGAALVLMLLVGRGTIGANQSREMESIQRESSTEERATPSEAG